MTSVRCRENTFKIDLSNFAKRPSFEEIHLFVREKIGLTHDQLVRLQMNHAQNCAHIKCVDLKTAMDAVDQHHEKHEMEVNGKKTKVRLAMDDGGVEVKLHDLSENVSNEDIMDYLMQYGEVTNIKEVIWGEHFAFKGVSSGIRIVKMTLRKHIKSFVTIKGEQTLVTYKNQPQTCRHCSNLSHPGSTCVQNRKLLGQKADLEKRLKNAQKNTNANETVVTYSTVLNSKNPINQLMPHFATSTADHMSTELPTVEQTNETVLPPTATTNASETNQADTNTTENITSDSNTHGLNETQAAEDRVEHMMQQKPTSSGSNFKMPQIPGKENISMEFSENESSESCAENANDGFKAVKRGRGRPKKLKLDASRTVSPSPS